MPTRPDEAMSKAQLLKEVQRLRASLDPQEEVDRLRVEVKAEHALVIEMQRLLAESRDRYADLFEFAPVGYALLDGYGILKDVNFMGARLLGAERARLLGYPLHAFVTDKRAFIDYLARCRKSPESVETGMSLRTRNGRLLPVHLTAKRFAPVENVLNFHVAMLDMSEQKRAEEDRFRIEGERQLARAASEAKDRFIAVLSHELRTPLTPILFTLASIRESGTLPAEHQAALDMIGRNAELEARLIDDLLDVTRITQGKLHLVLETVDAHAVVEEVLELCRQDIRQAGLHVSLDLAASAHHVSADATRLRQVLWNLVKNATRATPAGGGITISTRNEVPGRLTLAVQDTGRGISPAGLEKVFGPFEQVAQDGMPRSAGLGLGLAIAKGIVDALGGRIAATSRGPGRGATFTVELGVAPALPAAPGAPSHPPLQAGRATKVLLVEDNRDNGTAIAELLRAHGYEVDLAESVRDALSKAENGFDVLVSDIGLPDGTGRDLIRQLAMRSPVPAIALTGYGSHDDIQCNGDAGFARHLTKPVDPDDLLAAIHELALPAPSEASSAVGSNTARKH